MAGEVVKRIFEYDNYRFFLRDFFKEQKRLKAAFSHRFFARRAGFSSSSFCAHVIEGKRNLTADSLRRMLKGLGLSGRPATYFESLVHYNQARTAEDRDESTRALERLATLPNDGSHELSVPSKPISSKAERRTILLHSGHDNGSVLPH